MIPLAEQLGQAIEQMGRMQRIIESYRNDSIRIHVTVLAEGPLEQLRQLKRQIYEYIQRMEAAGTSAST